MGTIKLPAYVRPKTLASGAIGYFWELPTWAKPPAKRHGKTCPIVSTPLGTDVAAMFEKAEAINAAFKGWREGEGTQLIRGSVRWLFAWYREQDKFKKNGFETRRGYEDMMRLVADCPMKSGGTFGDRAAGKVDTVVADRLYKKLKPRGLRQATYAMQVCRIIWNIAKRNRPHTGIAANPFASMGLVGSKGGNRDTTREEYDLYRKHARALGYQSMATAAALAFELAARAWDVFGYEDPDGKKARGFPWVGYRPGVSITYQQSKGGKIMTLPLSDKQQIDGTWQTVALYPDLEEELGRTPRTADLIVVEERSGLPYKKRRVSNVHREICNAAGLPTDMKFTGFRHGAATELGDAGETDMRPITGHTELSTTAIYNKANAVKARRIGAARRAYVEGLSERDSGITSEPEAEKETKNG
ncbi:MAG: tyrosine-type recombinase/integrase [Pseudomonadota bacterium]